MKKNKKFNYLPIAILTINLLILVWIISKKLIGILDSDMASELILSKILSENNQILSKDWYYSTELRVLNAQLIYSLVFKFLNNWSQVRIISYFIMYVLMIIVFLATNWANKYKYYFATMLILPFSYQYWAYVLSTGYYIFTIVITFLTIGLVETYLEESKISKTILLIVLVLLAFIAGLGGPRQVFVLYAPLLASALLLTIINIQENHGWKNFLNCLEIKYFISIYRNQNNTSKKYFFASSVLFVTSCVGYLTNKIYLSKMYSFEVWNNLSFTSFNINRFSNAIMGFISSFGYREGSLFSSYLIVNLFTILIIVITITALIYPFVHKNEVEGHYFRLSLFVVSALAFYIFLYSFTNVIAADRYTLPIVILFIPLTMYFFNSLNIIEKSKNKLVILFLILVISISGLNYFSLKGVDNTKELREIRDVLLDNDCLQGYGSFWQGNVLTELSNGRIEMWLWIDSALGEEMSEIESVDQIMQWLQNKSHLVSPSNKMFLLFTRDEFKYFPWRDNLDYENVLYETDNYIIFVYDTFYSYKFDCEH